MPVSYTPWMGSFTLTDTNAHQLLALLKALPAAQQPIAVSASVPRCQYLIITNDIDNGGAKLYVGNSGVTTSFYGHKLVASQFVPLYSVDANLIRLDQIYLLTDTNPTVVTVSLLTR